MYPRNFTNYLLFLLLLPLILPAQGGVIELPQPNVKALLAEDERLPAERFAAPLLLDLAPASAPEAEAYTSQGSEVEWTRTFAVPRAHGLGFLIDELALPAGGRLLLTNDEGRRGPFEQADASAERRLHTGFLPGSTVTITYRGPQPDSVPFRLHRLDHVYRADRYAPRRAKDFGDADDCQVNANCPTGDDWAAEKSGTARIRVIVAEGVGWCSGNLINNTARDGRPLLLSGFHCMDGFTPLYDLWETDFGYLAPGCADPATEPTPTASYVGVRFLAGRQESDFLLLEITDETFAATEHYFAGWDRSDGDVNGTVTHLHHPQGDVQKISQSGPTGMGIVNQQITWNSEVVTPPNHHFRMVYATGSFETGSSGSAFFDANHRIRGQLNGGNANCPGTSEAFVGRFSVSWNSGLNLSESLQFWLDPLGENPMTLDGAAVATKKFVSGFAVLKDKPVPNVHLVFAWNTGGRDSAVTNNSGFYRLERPAEATAFTVEASYAPDGDLDRAVDVGDLIAVRRHLLGLAELPVERQIAADVNGSGTIRVSDITAINRVILGLADWNGRPNWVVLPVGFPVDPLPTEVDEPIGVAIEQRYQQDLQIDFGLLKTGDATGDATRE